jgi:hypothetical protein
MNAIVIERPRAQEVVAFLEFVARTPQVLKELKAAPDDEQFVRIAVARGKAAGIDLTEQMLLDQMLEDRRMVRLMPLEEVERIADGLLGARMSGGHKSNMPPAC